jgi:hypothetical protein
VTLFALRHLEPLIEVVDGPLLRNQTRECMGNLSLALWCEATNLSRAPYKGNDAE